MRILLIEDEATIRHHICYQLQKLNFTVDIAEDGEQGLYLGLEYPYDVAIIDLGLPKLSGIEVITQIRQAQKRFPVLILTARGLWQDKVKGLEAGADDYLVKPFHIEELAARVNALIRRSAGWIDPVLRCGPITLNTSKQQVTKEGQLIELTAYEYRLLHLLMLHAGEVLSKTDLIEHIYEQDYDRDSNVIEVFIKRLRQKLDHDKTLNPIETMRGRGYRFSLARDSEEANITH